MPRSYQAYPQNAVVTHSPATVNGGDPSQAIQAASGVFKYPSLLDICSGVTNGTSNPFMSGLNVLGDGNNTSGVGGQTGNMLSGLQLFVDTLCGFALGGNTTGDILQAVRNLHAQSGNAHIGETILALRRLRDTVGTGTTPQTVLSGVESVTGLVNSNPVAQDAIAQGQAAAGVSGNQIIDAVNGGQTMADQSSTLLTGQTISGASGTDLLTQGGQAINQNTANHAANQSLTTAQSVSLKQQNLLVSQDFHAAYSIVGSTQWGWDGTDGSPSTNAPGCARCVCNGFQQPLLSSEIPVVAGETIEVAAMVKWSGLTYTGASPIVLSVEKYRLMKDPNGSGRDTYSDIGHTVVYTVPTPGASSTGLTGTTNGWLGIAGTYTVDTGVDQLRFRLEVLKNATAGTVKWDDAEFLKLDLIPANAVPGITDNIVTQLYGSAGSGFTANDAAAALANTRDSLTSVAAEVAALQAQGHTGNIAGDDFTYTGALGAPNWSVFYSNMSGGSPLGSYAANGTDAVFTASPANTQQCSFKWTGTDATSTTDYQLIQLLLDSPLQTDINGNLCFVSLRGRIDSAGTTYVDAHFGSDGSYSIGYRLGGSFIPLKSGTCPVPGASSTLSLYCGDKTNTLPRRFILKVGSTTIDTVDDTGSVTAMGTSYRGWGWGAVGDGSWTTTAAPPAINQWLAMDQ